MKYLVVAYLAPDLKMHSLSALTNNEGLADHFDLPVVEWSIEFLDNMREYNPVDSFYLLATDDLELTSSTDIESSCRAFVTAQP